ncbi:hypothetical protein EOD41_17470 [Mucilaginibacter limnophilus]|uniref:Response regulatory domain-containing protein n=1 Tax=Mucilaginibacter limnophilus TaxID=1932778 RepID=A0A3S3TEU4_9SPHI|nr:hypothetical protein [Mucilaginibacter limnophilus]RVT98161.1 hypothetical protein EOD41_17470 [Mucilaginibacter limnophilus]
MIRQRFKRVLLVAPDNPPRRLAAEYQHVTHVSDVSRLFPVIFELKPDLILFDYSHVKKDIEPLVRRLRMNTFYKKTKICCYKPDAHTATDELLKAIGVNYFVYPENLSTESTEQVNIFTAILDASLMRVLAKVAQ